MTVDQKTFEHIITTGINATAEVFGSMDVYIRTAQVTVRDELTGKALYDAYDTLPQECRDAAVKAVCLEAFYMAIPFLDLVLTPTGFGVVSNSNLAPASRDRMASLTAQVKACRDNAFDALLISLHTLANEEWSKTVASKLCISSLYWTARELRLHAGRPKATRSDLHELRPLIEEAEERIRQVISAFYFDSVIESIRINTVSDADALIVAKLRTAVGAFLADKPGLFSSLMDRVVNLLENNITDYPKYKDSEAYKVKHFEHYKNEKEDTTYFFG